MSMDTNNSDRPELVFALVGAAGTRLTDLGGALRAQLNLFDYQCHDIHLSKLLNGYSGSRIAPTGGGDYERIRHLQETGNEFRTRSNDGAALARAAIVEIRKKRCELTGSPDRPSSAQAYILHQLKHPQEVDLLRAIYGQSFVLLAGHAPRPARVKELAKRLAKTANRSGQELEFESKAIEIITIDEAQDDLGQNTRDTYPKADFFANLGLPGGESALGHFVDLLFGHPYWTPSPEEYAMNQAHAVSLRSSDDNRQVGAAIVNLVRNHKDRIVNADVVALGMNEVPRGGGGFYWVSESPDERDQWLSRYRDEDRAGEIKSGVLAELLEKLRTEGWLHEGVSSKDSKELAETLLKKALKRTQFINIGEFSRPVHGEMAAIIDAARRGVSINGLTMFVTTFPCHNCAKHIIAAGIKRVIYLEPYPKSRANYLHSEEMSLDSIDGKEEDGKVVFSPFTGIAPRQYAQLFSMTQRGAKKGMSWKAWDANRRKLIPRYVASNASLGYTMAERQELERLLATNFNWDKAKVCPAPPAATI